MRYGDVEIKEDGNWAQITASSGYSGYTGSSGYKGSSGYSGLISEAGYLNFLQSTTPSAPDTYIVSGAAYGYEVLNSPPNYGVAGTYNGYNYYTNGAGGYLYYQDLGATKWNINTGLGYAGGYRSATLLGPYPGYNGPSDIATVAAVGTSDVPASGHNILYFKSNGSLYRMGSDGIEHLIG